MKDDFHLQGIRTQISYEGLLQFRLASSPAELYLLLPEMHNSMILK